MIGIRTSAVERAMEVPQVILRAIDGRVKWDPSRRDPGDFGRLRSVHSADSTDQSGMNTESTPPVFNKSIWIAEKWRCVYHFDETSPRLFLMQRCYGSGRGKQRPYTTWKSQESIAWRQKSAFARIEAARIGTVFACLNRGLSVQ